MQILEDRRTQSENVFAIEGYDITASFGIDYSAAKWSRQDGSEVPFHTSFLGHCLANVVRNDLSVISYPISLLI